MNDPYEAIKQYNNLRDTGETIEYHFGKETTIGINGGPQTRYDSIGDALQGIVTTVGSMVAGATSATLGLPSDIGGLFVGIKDAVSAEDGQRIDAFVDGFNEFSKANLGSQYYKSIFDNFVDGLNVDPKLKEDAKSGFTAGEFGGVGGTATATAKAGAKTLKKGVEKLGEKAQRELDLEGTGTTVSAMGAGELDTAVKKGLAKFAPNNILEDTKLVLNKRAEEMKLATDKRTQPSGENKLFDTSNEAYSKQEVAQKETPVPRIQEGQVFPLNQRSKPIVEKTDAIAEALAKKIIPFLCMVRW